LLAKAHEGTGGKPVAPASASKPSVNLYNRSKAARAVVQGNFRLTDADAENDVRHIILSLGDQNFPVLEGQSIGVVVPGTDESGKPHQPRLYSIASARDGEKPNANNIALTVKREPGGLASNYLCDLEKGSEIDMTGPFGATFLMPNDPQANIIMICTGTGSAPFRAFTERRRRTSPNAQARCTFISGRAGQKSCHISDRSRKCRTACCTRSCVTAGSRGEPKEYVQDRMRKRADTLCRCWAMTTPTSTSAG
jgi:benzoyl-CoA 2,3-dioxygenase component A